MIIMISYDQYGRENFLASYFFSAHVIHEFYFHQYILSVKMPQQLLILTG